MSWELGLAAAGFMLAFVTSVVVTVRKISETEINLRTHIDEKDKETRGVLMLAVDRSRSEFGESVKAVRVHADTAHQRIEAVILQIKDVELYIRDNYVEVNSFNKAMDRIEDSLEKINGKMDRFMDR